MRLVALFLRKHSYADAFRDGLPDQIILGEVVIFILGNPVSSATNMPSIHGL